MFEVRFEIFVKSVKVLWILLALLLVLLFGDIESMRQEGMRRLESLSLLLSLLLSLSLLETFKPAFKATDDEES